MPASRNLLCDTNLYWLLAVHHYMIYNGNVDYYCVVLQFLVFDTQRIIGGKNRKNPVSPEEHILGAMELYLDIVYLFLIILSCFGNKN